MTSYDSEAAYAAELQLLLRENGWRVYPEIAGIDLVAISPQEELYAIETKLRFGHAVLEQCWKRLPFANAVIAATPCLRSYGPKAAVGDKYVVRDYDWMHGDSYDRQCGRLFGIGLWVPGNPFTEVEPPVKRKIQDTRVKDLLMDAAENHTDPGKASCRRWSEWDVLQEKYVEHLRAYGQGDLGQVIVTVEPQLRGKRCLITQAHYDSRRYLIACGRWRKLALDGKTLRLKAGV